MFLVTVIIVVTAQYCRRISDQSFVVAVTAFIVVVVVTVALAVRVKKRTNLVGFIVSIVVILILVFMQSLLLLQS